ncbi:response regulator transcription factor [Puteibacter caeruleilacunae]|nr:response regulator transcription factor [Puteibacter caeruleilacunae]
MMNNQTSNKIKCIAVDDEPFALKIIEEFCNQIPSVELTHCFNNPVEANQYLQHHKPDIVFLDIRMPDISGIQLAETIKSLPFIIFTTAHAEYAVKSYSLDAIDYLLKPFDFERFYKAIQKAEKHLRYVNQDIASKAEKDFITVKADYMNIKINIDDILYIESVDNYVKIHVQGKHYMPQLSMKAVLDILPIERFIRVHKSYAVARNKVSFFNNKQLTIDDISIPIGRTYLPGFKDAMQ